MSARWAAIFAALFVAIGTVFLVLALAVSGQSGIGTEGAEHCPSAVPQIPGGLQFSLGCDVTVASPDGRWRFVHGPPRGQNEDYAITVTDAYGRLVGPVGDLNDGMPFVLLWSPRPNWFLVNHWRGSFMEQPRVFEITPFGVVEHDRFLVSGQEQAIRLSPCLGDGSFEANWGRPPQRLWANGTGHRWSRDGRRIIWDFQTRIDACMERGETGSVQPDDRWRPFFMISDVETGALDPASIRIIEDERGLPTGGPYANF